MRITIQALIEGVQGSEPRAETIGVVERDADGAPASGLGLFLRETHAVLRQLQAVLLREQVAQFVECQTQGSCPTCASKVATSTGPGPTTINLSCCDNGLEVFEVNMTPAFPARRRY